MTTSQTKIRVAVTQAQPVWLDLDKTVEKTCALIAEAATNGAQLVTFPECWIPGYPAWIWSRPVDLPLHKDYILNSLHLPSPQLSLIQDAAAKHKIIVVLGFSENIHDSLYISQAIISASGELLTTRKKLKPTHMERTVFGDAPGASDCLHSVVDTPVGRVGALSCWEHIQPLLKYHTYSQREAIHVAAWPPLTAYGEDTSPWSMSAEGAAAVSQTYAIEGQCFVLHTTAVITEAGIEKMRIQSGGLMNKPGGGASAVFAPDGRKVSIDIDPKEEGILYADLDFDKILGARTLVDVCGHYSRPDLLWLGVERGQRRCVREETRKE
ncbi:carbon-nitrogen hydrolase [Aspergillus granulosus]|uniref:nitrilase n=1 Tax=Aspergillus granulosus TaxID=176169 RepID=A0ABR4I5C9_9EURO